jgi:hypothetical protein
MDDGPVKCYEAESPDTQAAPIQKFCSSIRSE